MKDKNKDMIKALGTGIVLGGIITGGGVYASTVGASSVSYSNASSGLSATNAQGAIDALYEKASTYIDPSYINFYDMSTNSSKNILGSESGVCINKDGKISCFKPNNFETEKNHIKEVFSSNGTCTTNIYGNVDCESYTYGLSCLVFKDTYNNNTGIMCRKTNGKNYNDCTATHSLSDGTNSYHCN